MAVITPFIPETITVHLGRPDEPAENVTVSFPDYIKNVASSEIYPTWPESALRANIYAIISFALNRYFTEWYPSRGYDFDITSSTTVDQAFKKDRDIFDNISEIVDEIYNDYVVRRGQIQPYFTQFCNGTTARCEGLSQWGTVGLAERGLIPYEILQYYYGDDIDIVRNAPVADIEESYPGVPLAVGVAGNDVSVIQKQLNRIGRNYPAIPRISNTDGLFDAETEEAVRTFQQIFDLPPTGTVDKATWYKIKRYFTAITRLGELVTEGLTYEDIATPYPGELKEGMSGTPIKLLQYYLNILAYFNPALNTITSDGVFGTETLNAVKVFQEEYGLPQTGIVDRRTWNRLTEVYNETIRLLPEGYERGKAKLFPGYLITPGARGEDVRDLQSYLDFIAQNIRELPRVTPDGIFGPQTLAAVNAFQNLFGLPQTRYVGAVTWDAIRSQYDALLEE